MYTINHDFIIRIQEPKGFYLISLIVHSVSFSSRQNLHSHLCHQLVPGGSVVKNLPAMQETQVRSLGLEDPLEEEMATHSLENPMDRGAWWVTV